MDTKIKLVKEWREETIHKIDEERNQLLSIFDNIREPVFVASMDTHRILYANNAVKESFWRKGWRYMLRGPAGRGLSMRTFVQTNTCRKLATSTFGNLRISAVVDGINAWIEQ